MEPSSVLYFRKEYRQDKQRIEKIDELLEPVWLTLESCRVDGNHWPYQLVNGAKETAGNKSVSTASMILFAICVELGYISKHHFDAPDSADVPLESVLSDTDRQKLKSLIPSAVKRIAENTKDKKPREKDEKVPTLSCSGSFGIDDPFTVSWLLAVLVAVIRNHSVLKVNLDESFLTLWNETCDAARVVISRLNVGRLDSEPVLDTTDTASPHAFPVLRSVRICEMIKGLTTEGDSVFPNVSASNEKVEEATVQKLKDSLQGPKDAMKTVDRANIHIWFIARLHQHLSFASICDAPFDAAELAFSLEGYLLGDGVGNEPLCDPDLLDRVFSILEERQQVNPYWRPLKPFVTNQQGFALLPLSVEIVNSLFRACTILGDHGDGRFTRHAAIFQRYFEWIEIRKTHGSCQINGTDGFFTGWHSEHLQQRGCIHLWETSQVAIYLLQYREMLRGHLARRSADAAHLKVRRIRRKKNENLKWVEFWNGAVGKNEPMLGDAEGVYKHIADNFLKAREQATGRKSWSMVLFGPPGTGKTGIAEGLAETMKWRFIEITPSDFVASGEAEVELRAKEIFDALTEQDEAVILFDEIDRLVMDRDAPAYSKQGDMFQVMTPGMLTKLKTLRTRARSIFIIATNYIERIDPAAIRVGRIDHHYLVGLPNLEARRNILRKKVEDEFALVGDVKYQVDGGALRDLQPNDMTNVANSTPLFSYGELCEIVRLKAPSVREASGQVKIGELNVRLIEAVGKSVTPTVRLSSYTSRFQATCSNPGSFPWNQEPIEEFLQLVSLASESGYEGPILSLMDKGTVTKIIVAACEKEGVYVKTNQLIDPQNQDELMKKLEEAAAKSEKLRALKELASKWKFWINEASLHE